MTLSIKVLGTGCRNCTTLDRITRQAVTDLALDADVEKVEDYAAISSYGVMSTPALVIDDQVVAVGRVPTPTALRDLLTRAADAAPTPDTSTGKETVMIIKVLGPGCDNCQRLEAHTREALALLGLEATVEKVTDYGEIAGYGVMRTPGLVVDERVVVSGRVPTAAEITALLKAA